MLWGVNICFVHCLLPQSLSIYKSSFLFTPHYSNYFIQNIFTWNYISSLVLEITNVVPLLFTKWHYTFKQLRERKNKKCFKVAYSAILYILFCAKWGSILWQLLVLYRTWYVCIGFRVHKWRSLFNQTFRLWSEPSSVIFIKI